MFQPLLCVEELFIDKLKEECDNFMKKHGENYKNEIFRFPVSIHVGDLMDKDGTLGEMVLNTPLEASFVLKAFIYNSIISNLLLPSDFPDENLMTVPRYEFFPGFTNFEVSDTHFVEPSELKRLFTLRGIVTSVSRPPQDYTQCAHYKCFNVDCPKFVTDQKLVRIHIPGATEWDVVNPSFKCFTCGLKIEEDLKLRQLGKKVTATVVITKRELSLGFEKVIRNNLMLIIRDELTNGLEIGKEYVIVGFPIVKWREGLHYVEVNNVIHEGHLIERRFLGNNHIYKMAQTLKDNPWTYCLNLAYLFADEITSPGFLYKVKLGLLLSLVGINCEEDLKNASILVVCDDDVKTRRFFNYASQFCSRRVSHTNNSNLLATQNKEYLECGSMELARDGVCLVNANTLSKTNSENLSHLLIRGFHQVMAGQETASKVDLACRVWSTLELHGKTKKRRISTNFSSSDVLKLGNFAHKLMSEAFSLVYVIGNPENDDDICHNEIDHCLKKAMGQRSHDEAIPESDWSAFLETARNIKTEFTSEAKNLLTEYFVAVRNTSSSTSSQSNVPMTTISKLRFVAKAFAKLCLRDNVTKNDAIMSIYVLEEINTILRENSSLMLRPEFSFKQKKSNHEEEFQIFQNDLRRILAFKSSQITCNQEE